MTIPFSPMRGGGGSRFACSVAGLTLPLWCPRGAWWLGLPPYPAFSFISCPLSPDPLPQRGRGRPRLFHARGFAPCIPGAEPGRHGLNLRCRSPAGGLPARLPAAPAFNLPFCPLTPRPPSRREGGDFLFSYARGSAPCIPAPEPEAARAEPAVQEPSGGLAVGVARLSCL